MPKLTRLRTVRDKQFMSQKELAEKSGVHEATIRRLEAGETAARYSTVRKLATALGVEPGELT